MMIFLYVYLTIGFFVASVCNNFPLSTRFIFFFVYFLGWPYVCYKAIQKSKSVDRKENRYVLKAGLVYNPFIKWPRNLSCFCGSAQKFKKCCESTIPFGVPAKKAHILATDFDRVLTHVKKLHDAGLVYSNQETSQYMKGRKRS